MNTDRIRDYLKGKSKVFGYIVGSTFGGITPFCSCSSIPLFLGFTSARIPMGVTLAFLITSPLLNEVALVLLGSILGWKFALYYALSAISAGIVGGVFFDFIKSERFLQDEIKAMQKGLENQTCCDSQDAEKSSSYKLPSLNMTARQRHHFALGESKEIFRKIWIWVIVGVGVGAGLHGFVPAGWIEQNLAGNEFWSVPIAALLGIPLYSNASGMIPVVESLLAKGLPVGTALALMMSVVGASLPEFIMLKQVLKTRLLAYLFGYFLVSFTLIGWFMNAVF